MMSLPSSSVLSNLEAEFAALAQTLARKETKEKAAAAEINQAKAEAEHAHQALGDERAALEQAQRAAETSHALELRLLSRVSQLESDLSASKRSLSEAEEAHLHEWTFLEADLSAKMEEKDRALDEVKDRLWGAQEELEGMRAVAQGQMPREDHRQDMADVRRQYEAKIKALEEKIDAQQQVINKQQAAATVTATPPTRASPKKATPASQQYRKPLGKKSAPVRTPLSLSIMETPSAAKRKKVTFDLERETNNNNVNNTPMAVPRGAPKISPMGEAGRKSLGALLSIQPKPPTIFGAMVNRASVAGNKRKLFTQKDGGV